MKYHLIHEIVSRKYVDVEMITSTENIVDPFTKTFFTKLFDDNRDNLGIRCVPSML